MAEQTLFDLVEDAGLVDPSFFQEGATRWNTIFGDPMLGGGTVHITHIFMALIAAAVIVIMALFARKRYSTREEAMIPEDHLSARNAFEVIFDAAFDLMADMMGRENAKRYFPLIAALSVFILVSNLLGIIPGMVPPTQNPNTTIAMSVSVFVAYNLIGFARHGFAYLKEFAGPIWWLIPLMFVIELVGHVFRPISLAVRLSGNMTGDHQVLGAFGNLATGLVDVPFLLPVPFLFLGLLISIIQTLVFVLLSMIYIAMAVEEGH